MYHSVNGLIWAKPVAQGPWGAKPSRARGAKAQGLRYERAVGRELANCPGITAGQWWQFTDLTGPHFCQTDFIIRGLRSALVLEVKLTWTAEGHGQLSNLYVPVIGLALGMPTHGVQICKGLRPDIPRGVRIVRSLEAAIEVTREPFPPPVVLHWLGEGKQNIREWVRRAA